MASLSRTQHGNGLPSTYYIDGSPVSYERYHEAKDRARRLSCFSTVSFRDALGDEAYRHYCEAEGI